MNLFANIKLRMQISKSLKSNGLSRKQFKKSMREHRNRNLDIQEILSREYSDHVVIDAYEYCMRKCGWEPSTLKESSVRDFLLCVVFEGEVNNGGISQFLSNSSGNMAEETVCALEKIDKPTGELLREALQCFPGGIVPKDRDARNALIEQFSEEVNNHLDELSRIVWESDNSQNCYNFLQAHKSDFLCF